MSLTALEIKQRTFAKSLRGYDISEVNAFLSMIAHDWEFQVGKIKDLERELKSLNDKIAHYQRIEGTLHETLQTARDNASERLENARKDAANKIQKAEVEAEQIVQDARQEKQKIRKSTLELIERRREMIDAIESYLESARKSIDSFKSDKSDTFAPLKEEEADNDNKNNKKKSKSSAKDDLSDAPGMEKLDDLVDDID
jgi:cell division initiation protein